MNAEQLIELVRLSVLVAGHVAGLPLAAQMVDYALKQAALAAAENRMTPEEIDRVFAEAKAARQAADSAWDELVKRAREARA